MVFQSRSSEVDEQCDFALGQSGKVSNDLCLIVFGHQVRAAFEFDDDRLFYDKIGLARFDCFAVIKRDQHIWLILKIKFSLLEFDCRAS